MDTQCLLFIMRTDDPKPRITELRALGMSETIIFNRLVLEGWDEKTLTEAFAPLAIIGQTPSPSTTPAQIVSKPSAETPRSLGAIAYASLGLVALAVASSAGAFWFFSKPPIVYSISLSADASSTVAALSYGALPALSDPQYYRHIKKQLIAQQVSFIDADLSSMQLVVYTGGIDSQHVPILAKGKIGSWWETPAGIYKIETKESTHFSTFGNVEMPYSLDFQGNFFIHGWPVYPDGTVVSSTYSGGCIRLSTEDAKKVFELVAVGMPVVVYNSPIESDTFSYQLKGPRVSATEYLVADANNGTVLLSRNASSTAAIASVTKLVTALVATEYINLDKKIIVQPEDIVYTAVPRLRKGQQVKAYDLLFLLLQESSNEAAEALAGELGRDRFVSAMNEKARAIGLRHTHFNDPSGAKDDISTPEDLFALLRYIRDNRKFVFGITTGEITDSAYGEPAFRGIANFNIIKNAPATLLGGKIGQTTEAGETYAGIFSVKVGGIDRDVAIVVLGSDDSEGDTRKLLNFVHTSYDPGEPVD